jgi:class 3 adenylate cyclase
LARENARAVDLTNHLIVGILAALILPELVYIPMELIDPITMHGLYQDVLPLVIPFNNIDCTFSIVYAYEAANPLFMGRLMAPLTEKLVSETSFGMGPGFLVPLIILCVIMVIAGFILVIGLIRLGDGAVSSLRLFLFCPSSIMLQTVPIQKVLSNDFSSGNELQNDDKDFFQSVVSHMLDAVVFMSPAMQVISVNPAIESVLGLDPVTVIGQSLSSLFVPPAGCTSVAAFLGGVTGAMNSQRAPALDADLEHLRGETTVHLHVRMQAISWSGQVETKPVDREALAIIVFVIRDTTRTTAAATLLREEGIKSEKLLLMILPPVIVTKLQAGEKNLSFAVKSASILFLDIVSFTPWCGAHDASYVMATLNRMFLEFDRLVKLRDRLTKIKCIGDCYMCAGGLFDEVSQPQVHAEQMISFGLDTIHALQLLDIELKETLKIRVGVNTGGPIVAGVLGIEKPSFDILGPAICLAAAMEHHGVPMSVHIPQHCYDLIYNRNFNIQERGAVEVKGVPYQTYLVTGYKQE